MPTKPQKLFQYDPRLKPIAHFAEFAYRKLSKIPGDPKIEPAKLLPKIYRDNRLLKEHATDILLYFGIVDRVSLRNFRIGRVSHGQVVRRLKALHLVFWRITSGYYPTSLGHYQTKLDILRLLQSFHFEDIRYDLLSKVLAATDYLEGRAGWEGGYSVVHPRRLPTARPLHVSRPKAKQQALTGRKVAPKTGKPAGSNVVAIHSPAPPAKERPDAVQVIEFSGELDLYSKITDPLVQFFAVKNPERRYSGWDYIGLGTAGTNKKKSKFDLDRGINQNPDILGYRKVRLDNMGKTDYETLSVEVKLKLDREVVGEAEAHTELAHVSYIAVAEPLRDVLRMKRFMRRITDKGLGLVCLDNRDGRKQWVEVVQPRFNLQARSVVNEYIEDINRKRPYQVVAEDIRRSVRVEKERLA